MIDYWWKNAVIYGVDVERFYDGNGDGIGDFLGLTEKLDYIRGLGATCIWLLPFFPSTDRDNGYDVTDYFRVDSRYGEFDDFLTFVRAAGERSMRIIVDLVTHHTSSEHPWFQSARHSLDSPFRDYYVWSDHPPPTAPGKGPMFPGEETSVWTFDEVARSYYYHRFYNFQPGLNHRNPAVISEIERVIDFWMSFGISGFRVDAASHMIEDPLDPEGAVDPAHSILRKIYGHVTKRKPDAVVLGEVDEDEGKLKTFFDGQQLNMMFNFFLDNYLLFGLAQKKAEPIRDALSRLPPPPMNGQWANFLRNLDEADLERLTPEHMQVVLNEFAPEQDMRIFGRGIRRRLAPMLGDPARLRMAYSLLFSMPGAPLICYGDEIGMGEDLSQSGRNSVRMPMQWTKGRNGGFSAASKARLSQPVIEQGSFSIRQVNVQAQIEDENSLLSLIRRLSMLRRTHRALGDHDCQLLQADSNRVLAHAYQGPDNEIVVLHNLGDRREKTVIHLDALKSTPPEILLGTEVEAPQSGRMRVDLEPYGFAWLKWNR
nr:alpha-amylase [Rhizobium sp. Q54]